MNMTESGHLKPRTVAIVFGVVIVAFLALCISVGAWPLVIGGLIAIILLPLFFLLIKVIAMILIGGPVYLLGQGVTHLLPRSFRVYASTREQPPWVAVLIFVAMVGILMLIFRSVAGVLGGLAVVGVLVGLPWLADWSRERRIKRERHEHACQPMSPQS
jgi:hypothetical protein